MSDDLRELLGAYALDAVDDLERARLERLVAADADAARELARYTDAVAALVTDDHDLVPPAAAWDAIRSRVATRPSTPLGRGSAPVRWWPAAVAAAVVAVVLGAGVVAWRDGDPSWRDRYATAATASGARTGRWSGSGATGAVVVGPDGTSYLTTDGLPDPGPGSVYQLWLLDSGTPVSLGVVDAHDGVARFRAPASGRAFALSRERAPGAAAPTLPPVATAQVG